MNRKEFVKTCGLGCIGLIAGPVILQGCAGTKYITAPIIESALVVPLTSFEVVKNNTTQFRKYIVVQNDSLEFPICVYRTEPDTFHALWMKCTHQGTELQVFGDKLQCPAHGSEFTNTGAVQNGPAAEHLRTFAVAVKDNALKITLR
ncbi:MAG: (2Fe-2S)-binding protein [Marivirga sp.]|nr:(2Fe-2S)-binding protein [Marivirga sp.]